MACGMLVVSAASPQLCALVSALRGGAHSGPWWTCSPAAVMSGAPFPPAVSSAVPPAAFAAQHIKLQVQNCEIFWMPFTQQNRKQTKAKYMQSRSDIWDWIINDKSRLFHAFFVRSAWNWCIQQVMCVPIYWISNSKNTEWMTKAGCRIYIKAVLWITCNCYEVISK